MATRITVPDSHRYSVQPDTAAIRPPNMPTCRTASSLDPGSITRQPEITTSKSPDTALLLPVSLAWQAVAAVWMRCPGRGEQLPG